MTLNIISLNVRGIKDMQKRRKIFNFYRNKCDVLCLQETHSEVNTEEIWRNEWGGDIRYAHGASNSRGVATLIKKNTNMQMKELYASSDGRVLIVKIVSQFKEVILCNLYAPNKDSPGFFADIINRTAECDSRILIGDFNLTLNTELDRNESSTNNQEATSQLLNDMESHLLEDIWRTRNPGCRRYSWYRRGNNRLQASRLDFAIISAGMSDQVHDTFYLNGICTDHSAYFVGFQFADTKRGCGTWKLNTQLLYESEYLQMINALLEQDAIKYKTLNPHTAWEYMKEDIKKHTMKYCTGRTSRRETAISQLSEIITEMENVLQENNDNATFLQLLDNSKADLDELLTEKIRSAIFRSGAKWYEDGEKNTKYFYSLESAKYSAKTCHVMFRKDGTLTQDPDEILEIQRQFYQELYRSDTAVSFKITNNTENRLPPEVTDELNNEFSDEELATAIRDLSNRKVPGPDGIPADFYKMFYTKLKDPLKRVIHYSYETEILHPTARSGTINVIPKPGRDTREVRNLRPITLLNTDYKIIEKMFANRMVPWLQDLIHEDQRGFVPGRRISVNIRKIFDIIHSANENGSPVIILQADLVKAFDRIEMCAIKGTLHFFGFSEYMINWISILYREFKVKVLNNGNLSTELQVQRSVHQGGCCSAAIFILIAELLAISIREDAHIRGAFIKDIENVLNLYADDTDMSLDATSDESLKRALKHIQQFHSHTGLLLNYEKTNVYRVGSLRNSKAQYYTEKQLNWSAHSIKVLGIEISNNLTEDLDRNYSRICDKAEKKLNIWRRRTLSLQGKINIVNTLVSSLFVVTR